MSDELQRRSCKNDRSRLTLPGSCRPLLSQLDPPRRRAARRWHAGGERTIPRWYSAAVRLRWLDRGRWSHSRTPTWRSSPSVALTLPWWRWGALCPRTSRGPDRYGMPKSTGNRRLLHPPSYPQAPAPPFSCSASSSSEKFKTTLGLCPPVAP